MNRVLTLTLLIGAAALAARPLFVAQAGGAEAAKATATVQANGTVVTTGISLPGVGVTLPAGCLNAASQTARVVCAANAFLATLTSTQKTQVILARTQANAIRWSNLPCGNSCRSGILLSTLNAAQLRAAQAVVKAAMGTSTDEGYSETMQILMADDVLGTSGGMGGPDAQGQGGPPPLPAGVTAGSTPPGGGTAPPAPPTGTPPQGGMGGGGGYASDNYYLAFLGTPSTTGIWQLQFGGHHLAVNTTYRGGQVVGATPSFKGTEPKVWTARGKTYAPLRAEQATMAKLLGSLSAAQLTSAKLSGTFSDILLGPGQDGKFPASKAGVRVGSLNAAQQALVLAAMKPWVQDTDDTTAAAMLGTYAAELSETYVAYSGNAALTKHADYVRIDGPSAWIEFVCQEGVVYRSQIHYHSVWRDHKRDYGAEYKF